MIAHGKEIKVFTANANVPFARGICCRAGAGPRRQHRHGLCRRRSLRLDQRNRPRLRRVRGAVHLQARQQQPDGAAHHDRRLPPRLRRPHHRRHSVFRLCPAGPQGQGPRPHLGQARGQPHHDRRRRPRADHGPARRADPGLLRHSAWINLLGNPLFTRYYMSKFDENVCNHDDFVRRLAGRRLRRPLPHLRRPRCTWALPSSTSAASAPTCARS